MASALFLLLWVFSLLEFSSSSSSSNTVCSHQSMDLFFGNLQSQCPISCYTRLPLEVDGEFIDRKFNSNYGKGYTSILFYGSSCPFSHNVRLTFQVLSSMFAQIEHLAVEQSTVMPSTFSQHGIHSLPVIIMVNKSSTLRYQGPKDLHCLVRFYKKTTGLEPGDCAAMEQPVSTYSSQKFIMQSWIGSSADEILNRETCLLLSVLFLCLRAFIHVFPAVMSHVKTLWILHQPLLMTSQVIERVLQMINDVKRVWTMLKFQNRGTFLRRQRMPIIGLSSLASVSFQKTPTF